MSYIRGYCMVFCLVVTLYRNVRFIREWCIEWNVMKQNNDVDTRTDSMKIEMAKHFEGFEAEYRTEPQHHEVVYEDNQVVIVADHTGHELREWASDFSVDRTELSQTMHTLARQVCDYDWSVSDPIVFDKLE